MLDDAILIIKIQYGGERAMEELVHRYYDDIYRYAFVCSDR